MRRPIAFLLMIGATAALPLLAACSDERAEANPSTRAAAGTPEQSVPAGLVRADFDVAGMDCGGCVIAARTALRKLDGVAQADASYDAASQEGAAWALYDPARVTPERMITAIRELGYSPTIINNKGN